MDKIEVGSTVADKLTQFQGTVIVRAEYLYDVPQLLVAARSLNVEGEAPEKWIAEARCNLINPPLPSA